MRRVGSAQGVGLVRPAIASQGVCGEPMAGDRDVQAALGRLTAALEDIEAAAHRQAQRGRKVVDLTEELALMRADRQKLAGLLDEATARGQALDLARRQVAERVERAIGAIRSVVEAPAET
jgi:hypothetical protein